MNAGNRALHFQDVAQGTGPQSPWIRIPYVIKRGAFCNASIYLNPFTALGLVMSSSRPPG